MAPAASIYASCVAVGARGVLIRGASGAGKSTLALRLILDAPRVLPPADLVADDRVLLTAEGGALIARPVPALAGLIEARGLGVRRMAHRASVALRYVIDLQASPPARMPEAEESAVRLEGIEIERISATTPEAALLLLAAAVASSHYEN